MNMVGCLSKINIGDAYKIANASGEVFGRIVDFDTTSACYNGEYAVVKFATPGGTIARLGRGWITKIDTQKDLAELKKYEELARARGEVLYGGLIET